MDALRQRKLLSFSSLQVKVKADGDEVALDSFLSRSQMRNITPAGRREVAFEKAPPAAQEILRDTFGPTLCRIEIRSEAGDRTRPQGRGRPGAMSSLEKRHDRKRVAVPPAVLRRSRKLAGRTSLQYGRRRLRERKRSLTPSRQRGPNVFLITGELINPLFQPAAGRV